MKMQVIVYDHPTNRRVAYGLDGADFALAARRQDEPLPISLPGKTHWSDLGIHHYNERIAETLHRLTEMPDSQWHTHDDAHRLVFLLCSLITIIEERVFSRVELLHLHRFGEKPSEIHYDYVLVMDLA